MEQEGKNGFGQAARPTTLKGLALYMKAHEESGPGDLDGYKDRKKVSDGQGYVGSSSEEEVRNAFESLVALSRHRFCATFGLGEKFRSRKR